MADMGPNSPASSTCFLRFRLGCVSVRPFPSATQQEVPLRRNDAVELSAVVAGQGAHDVSGLDFHAVHRPSHAVVVRISGCSPSVMRIVFS